MFLSKSKHVCLFLSLAAIPHFDAMAGKGDLLLKGATTPVRMSSTVRMSFSSHPASHSVMTSRTMTQGLWQASPSRRLSSVPPQEEPNSPKNELAALLKKNIDILEENTSFLKKNRNKLIHNNDDPSFIYRLLEGMSLCIIAGNCYIMADIAFLRK